MPLTTIGCISRDGPDQVGQMMRPTGESTLLSDINQKLMLLDLSDQQETQQGGRVQPDSQETSEAASGAEHSSEVPPEGPRLLLVVEEISDGRLRQLRDEALREVAAWNIRTFMARGTRRVKEVD